MGIIKKHKSGYKFYRSYKITKDSKIVIKVDLVTGYEITHEALSITHYKLKRYLKFFKLWEFDYSVYDYMIMDSDNCKILINNYFRDIHNCTIDEFEKSLERKDKLSKFL